MLDLFGFVFQEHQFEKSATGSRSPRGRNLLLELLIIEALNVDDWSGQRIIQDNLHCDVGIYEDKFNYWGSTLFQSFPMMKYPLPGQKWKIMLCIQTIDNSYDNRCVRVGDVESESL